MAKNNTPNFVEVVTGTLKRLLEKKVLRDDNFTTTQVTVLSGLGVQYFQQDDFTVAVLSETVTGKAVAAGVSKRNPTDQPMPLRGRSLALSRAVKEFVVKVVVRNEVKAEGKDAPAAKNVTDLVGVQPHPTKRIGLSRS